MSLTTKYHAPVGGGTVDILGLDDRLAGLLLGILGGIPEISLTNEYGGQARHEVRQEIQELHTHLDRVLPESEWKRNGRSLILHGVPFVIRMNEHGMRRACDA